MTELLHGPLPHVEPRAGRLLVETADCLVCVRCVTLGGFEADREDGQVGLRCGSCGLFLTHADVLTLICTEKIPRPPYD